MRAPQYRGHGRREERRAHASAFSHCSLPALATRKRSCGASRPRRRLHRLGAALESCARVGGGPCLSALGYIRKTITTMRSSENDVGGGGGGGSSGSDNSSNNDDSSGATLVEAARSSESASRQVHFRVWLYLAPVSKLGAPLLLAGTMRLHAGPGGRLEEEEKTRETRKVAATAVPPKAWKLGAWALSAAVVRCCPPTNQRRRAGSSPGRTSSPTALAGAGKTMKLAGSGPTAG